MKKIVAFLVLLLFMFPVYSQELKCTVTINSDMVQGTNKSVFNTLQKSVSEFINARRWSEMTHTTAEKIECSITIVVKQVEGDQFTADIQVQSRRPVYNSAYNTTLFNFKDNYFTFDYKEFDQLEMNESTITSNLTAVLAYYSYIIIGYDLDSYSRLGGTPFFEAAERIVNAAQAADPRCDQPGWDAE